MTTEELAKNYRIGESGAEIVRRARLVFLTGITAAGKNTIMEQIADPDKFHRLVSHTTRSPRKNNGIMELNGVDYHFVSVAKMARLLKRQQMVEINHFGQDYYGVSVAEVATATKAGRIAINDVDINGVQAFSNIAPDKVTVIFIVPPSYEIWLERLKSRYQGDLKLIKEVWAKRRQIAINELTFALNQPQYQFVVNDQLEQAVRDTKRIINQQKVETASAKLVAQELLKDIKQNKVVF